MKSITNSNVRALGKKELRMVFKDLRIKDGFREDEIGSDEFSYWYNKSRDGMCNNYLVYEIIDSEPAYRADDHVISRNFYCQIDIFSIQSFETKELIRFIERLENKLTEYRFEVEFSDELFESDTRLHHQILIISKIYF